MKKYIAILSILIFVCCFNSVVCAAPADPDGYLTDPVLIALADSVYTNWGYELNDTEKKRLWDYGFNPQDNYYLVLVKYPNNLNYYWSSDVNITNDVITMPTGYMMLTYSNGTADYNTLSNYQIIVNENTQVIGHYLDVIQGEPEIDYSIPVPNAVLTYAARVGENQSLDDLSSWIYLNNPNVNLDNLYVEVQYKYYIPTKLSVTPNNFGDSQFNVIEYAQSSPYNSVSLVSKTKLSELTSVNSGQKYKTILDNNNMNWLTFYNDNRNNMQYFNSTTSDLLINAENYFAVNRYKAQRDMLPGAFNVMEVFVRYYRIDGSDLRLGQWLHMKNDTTLDQQALNVSIPVLNPPTSTSVSDNIELPDDTNSIGTGVWLPSSSTDINVTINMPEQNTLNYPTIVSYNHDIAFKQYADTARNIPSFFTDVTNFATMAFSFIPPEVWAIVSMGLLLSIAVMVIKIL